MSKKIALSGVVLVLIIGIFTAMAICLKLTLAGGDSQKELKEPQIKNAVYQISTADDFLWLAKAVNDGSKSNAKAALTADIDLEGIDWTAAGTYEFPFKGVFDGNRHKIKNLKGMGKTLGLRPFLQVSRAHLKQETLRIVKIWEGSRLQKVVIMY